MCDIVRVQDVFTYMQLLKENTPLIQGCFNTIDMQNYFYTREQRPWKRFGIDAEEGFLVYIHTTGR